MVTVSDDNGETWKYKFLTFNGLPSGATLPVDPNVVLKSDGDLRMFSTVDTDGPRLQREFAPTVFFQPIAALRVYHGKKALLGF